MSDRLGDAWAGVQKFFSDPRQGGGDPRSVVTSPYDYPLRDDPYAQLPEMRFYERAGMNDEGASRKLQLLQAKQNRAMAAFDKTGQPINPYNISSRVDPVMLEAIVRRLRGQ